MRYARTGNRGERAGRVLLTLEHTVVGRLDVARWVPELDRSEDGLDPAEVLYHARVGEGSFRRSSLSLHSSIPSPARSFMAWAMAAQCSKNFEATSS